jgi:glycosyltransferase involved in cell wall biosynthesis
MDACGDVILSNPKVSVIITAYNRREFLEQAIESVASQDIDPALVELIVVTNFELDSNLFSKGIKISSIVMDGTIGEFLYAGVIASKSDVIAFLDDDDIFKLGKLRAVIDIFAENPDLCYYHNVPEYLNKYMERINYTRLVERRSYHFSDSKLVVDVRNNLKSIKAAIDINGDFNLSCIAVRRESYLEYLPLLKQITSCPDGFFFWAAIILGERMIIDGRKLTGYRVHNLNISGSINFENKVKEIEREIHTYDLLLSYIGKSDTQDDLYSYVGNWLFLYKLEYILISYIFQEVQKNTIFNRLIKLLSIRGDYSNALKYRIAVLLVIRLLNAELARKIYMKFRST